MLYIYIYLFNKSNALEVFFLACWASAFTIKKVVFIEVDMYLNFHVDTTETSTGATDLPMCANKDQWNLCICTFLCRVVYVGSESFVDIFFFVERKSSDVTAPSGCVRPD